MSYQIMDLTLGYAKQPSILTNFSLDIAPGQLIALIGRNGIGKSTLLRSLAGSVKPLSGDIRVDGKSLFTMKNWKLAQNIAFVTTEIVAAAYLKVWDVVSFGRSPYTNWSGGLGNEDIKIVMQAIDDVGVMHLKDTEINMLSDGERQRVMIARAIAQCTPIILLDEPSAFLDIPNRYQIAMLLRHIAHDQNKTIIFSSHDLTTAIKLCDTIWVMSPGQLVDGSPEELARSGAFNVIFDGTPLTFDSRSGEIHSHNRG